MKAPLLAILVLVAPSMAAPMDHPPSSNLVPYDVSAQVTQPSINVKKIRTAIHPTNLDTKKRPRKSKVEAKSIKETRELRQSKAKILGLKTSSALPMFAHKLTVEGIKLHPQIDSWNMHRQAMENGILEQYQLPPQFQSIKGVFQLLSERDKKKRFKQETEEQKEIRNKKSALELTRCRKIRALGLVKGSATPSFAHRLKVEDVDKSEHIKSWHDHRVKIENGLMRQEHLPEEFQSKPPGKLVFRMPEHQKAAIVQDSMRDSLLAERKQLQIRERQEKLKQLHLPRDSAMPMFAKTISADEIRNYDDIESWHFYRALLEEGKITENDLPDHFKPNSGTLKFYARQT